MLVSQGKCFYADGSQFEGEHKDDSRDGYGRKNYIIPKKACFDNCKLYIFFFCIFKVFTRMLMGPVTRENTRKTNVMGLVRNSEYFSILFGSLIRAIN